MRTFEIYYRPDADGPLKRMRRGRLTLIWCLVAFILLLTGIVALSIVFGVQLAFTSTTLLVLTIPVSVLIGVLILTIRLFSWRRTGPPPVALRLSGEGVTVWPMVGADFFLPWAYVNAVQTSRQGIAILAQQGTGADTPGAIGMADYASQALLRKPGLFHKEGLDWQSLQPFDVNELDAATRGFSSGHASVLRQ